MKHDERVGPSRREAIGTLSGGAVGIIAAPVVARAARAHATDKALLWYRKPASVWTEALPIGNGRIGTMVFGGIARERLQLNEDTLWGGGPYDPVNPEAKTNLPALRQMIWDGRYAEAEAFANAHVMARPLHQASYQPVGDLFLSMIGMNEADATSYERSLDLDAALAACRWSIGGVDYHRELVASPKDQVIAVRLSASRAGAIRCRLELTSPQKNWSVALEGEDTLVLSGRNDPEEATAGALRFEARIRVLHQGGRCHADGQALAVDGADEVTILIAMATSYRRYDDVTGDPTAITRQQIAAAVTRPYAQLAADTASEHRRLFRRVAIDLGTSSAASMPTDQRIAASATGSDPALAALYFQYARYLLIACSRPGGQAARRRTCKDCGTTARGRLGAPNTRSTSIPR